MSEPDPILLRMEGIEKSFGGVRALRGATVGVGRGTIHGLVGENGAGKSTLLKILDGQYPHGSFSGTITLDGQSIELQSPQDARAKGIAIVPQETHVIDSLTVGENICLGGHAGATVSVKEFWRRSAEFLERLGIPLNPRDEISWLSASQRQLVMIARALFQEPSLLILDEPTSALTKEESVRLFDLLGRLRQQGMTSVFVSHRIDEVVELCDSVTVMRDGMSVAEISRDDMNPQSIIRHMIGKELTELFPIRTGERSADPMLEVSSLMVRNPNRRNLYSVRDVSFSAHAGEIVGIGGLVGSGRSELLRAIYGDLPIDSGDIHLNGDAYTPRRARDAIDSGIGFVTEDRKKEGLAFNLSVRENLTLSDLARYGSFMLRARQESATVAEQLERFSVVTETLNSPIGTLSGGNQQKVLLARSLQLQPKLLLLDEPTVGVDIGAKREIYRLIGQLADQGIAVVMVSSESTELLGLCDRILVLRNGEIVDQFDRSEATEKRLMSAAMVGAQDSDD